MSVKKCIFFPESEPSIVNILYGWSGICGQLGLWSFMFSPAVSTKLILFELFNYIATLMFFIFMYDLFACSIRIYFYRINQLNSFEFNWILINFFSECTAFLASTSLLQF